MTTTYVVLGLARSGTSLCGGLLNIMGVKMNYTLETVEKAPKTHLKTTTIKHIFTFFNFY